MNAVQRALAVGIAAAVLQAVMLIAFVWPASNTKARDLPVAVAGAQAAMIADQLAQRGPGSFEFITVADAAAARAAIVDLEVYGAIVTEGGSDDVGAQVLISSAASPAAAQQMTQIAQQLSGAPAALVEDVVASDPDDLGGRGFAAMVLPLVMSSLAAGYLLALVVASVGARMAGLAVYSIAAGLLSMTIIQGWLSLIPGSFPVLAGVVGLISFSVSGAIVALGTVAGRTGLGIGGLTFLLLGNPLSAAATGPDAAEAVGFSRSAAAPRGWCLAASLGRLFRRCRHRRNVNGPPGLGDHCFGPPSRQRLPRPPALRGPPSGTGLCLMEWSNTPPRITLDGRHARA